MIDEMIGFNGRHTAKNHPFYDNVGSRGLFHHAAYDHV